MADDSFEKMKRGVKESGQGVKDLTVGAIETAEGVRDTAEGVIEGIIDAAEGVIGGVKDTTNVAKEGIEDTADVIKETADEAADSDTYKTLSEETKSTKYVAYRDYNEIGAKEPMNPDDIALHEPTAVKRDEDTEISEGHTRTDTAEARDKYRKKGMTETK